MRVLLVTQYFYPENFKSNDIAFELVKRGYQVDALVGIPNYPEGKYYKGYGIFKKRKEVINGVNVYRSFQISRGHGGIRLMLNYISYVISACFNVLFFFVFKKYDAIIVHETSPIFQAIPAILLKKINRIPMYMWVLDIWPDAMRSGGGVKNEHIIGIVDKIVKWVYRNTDKILISSKRFTESILPKGDFKNKIIYFPNWSEDILTMSHNYVIPELPSGFIIMLAGNLGKSQNLEAVVRTILELRDIEDLKWVFVGDGSKKEWLQTFVKEHSLETTVYVMGRFPFEAMPVFFEKANAMLVTLKAGFPHLGMVVPARLQSYMSAGRPVLAMIGDGGADVIKAANCGYAVPAGESTMLAKVIREQVLSSREAFEKMGRNGRVYFEKEFTKDKCIEHLCEILNSK